MSTSWEKIKPWYHKLVGLEGHYYHKHLILPRLGELMQIKPESKILDLACGQGIFGRQIPPSVDYLGIDIAPSFIQAAKKDDPSSKHHYQTADITKPLSLAVSFTHALIMLAIQNIEHPVKAFHNVSSALIQGGRLFIVMNHPCFRIPRQSDWGVDKEQKIQYRRINRYMSPLKIPIQANPGKGKQSVTTLSFHHPLSSYIQWLNEAGLSLIGMEEWCSPKESEGGAAKMENLSRQEIPLFLLLIAEKR